MLPWYVGLAPDNVNLDSSDSDNWDNLAISHSKQMAPARTPSGHPNIYGKIPFRFPAGVQLFLNCPASEALLCRRSWDDLDVICRANALLADSDAWLMEKIVISRFQALDFEKQVFKGGSYFMLRDTGNLSLDMLSNAHAVGDAGDEEGGGTCQIWQIIF